MSRAKEPVRYIQFEPAALVLDPQYEGWPAATRGVYLQLLVLLGASGGRLPFDSAALSRRCACRTTREFVLAWNAVSGKFREREGVISHPSVTRAIRRACKLRQQKSLAGQRGMQSRWGADNNDRALLPVHKPKDVTKESEGKRTEDKPREPKTGEAKNPTVVSPTVAAPGMDSLRVPLDSLAISATLSRLLPLKSRSDRTCMNNVAVWISELAEGRGDGEALVKRVCGLAQESCSCRNPAAAFMATLKAEMGYKPPSKKNYTQELKNRLGLPPS